jgi:hypothetical protein
MASAVVTPQILASDGLLQAGPDPGWVSRWS